MSRPVPGRLVLLPALLITGLWFVSCSPAVPIVKNTVSLNVQEEYFHLSTISTPIVSNKIPTIPIMLTYQSPMNTPTQIKGCQKPPEDYSLVKVNGMLINRRTLFMLETAAGIYHGEIEIAGRSITQGSFNDLTGGYGTHNGGGVVDISVMRPGTYTILYDDIPSLIHALRLAGFAAWLREPDEVYDGSPIHIHAAAVGDRTLSPAAREQVSGPGGYLNGFTGNPAPHATPMPDLYGGPVVCDWMQEIRL